MSPRGMSTGAVTATGEFKKKVSFVTTMISNIGRVFTHGLATPFNEIIELTKFMITDASCYVSVRMHV